MRVDLLHQENRRNRGPSSDHASVLCPAASNTVAGFDPHADGSLTPLQALLAVDPRTAHLRIVGSKSLGEFVEEPLIQTIVR